MGDSKTVRVLSPGEVDLKTVRFISPDGKTLTFEDELAKYIEADLLFAQPKPISFSAIAESLKPRYPVFPPPLRYKMILAIVAVLRGAR